MPKQAGTARRKKSPKISKRIVDPSVLQQIDELLEVLSGGDPRAQYLNATQLSEASIKLGLVIDIDLAQCMIEFCTGHEDDFEITKEQFTEMLKRLVDTDAENK